jgi:hypothetical protein
VADGSDWRPPILVRRPLASWDFETATTSIADAAAILVKRDRVADLARDLDLTVPAQLRTAYQTADTSFDDANAIADAELADLVALRTATDAADAPRDPLVSIGLLGSTPDAALADARTAFSRGSAGAAAAASAVTALLAGAADAGRDRLVLSFTAIVILLVIAVGTVIVRRRQRARSRIVEAAAAAAGEPAVRDSYATLAAPPSSARESSIEPPSWAEPATPPEPPADTGDAS